MANLLKEREAFLHQLKSTPRHGQFDSHYWTDYIELRCLFNVDGVFSKDDFLDSFRSNKDFSSKKQSINEEEDDDDNKQYINTNEPAFRSDKEEAFADRCFRLTEYRIKSLKDYYPFLLSGDKGVVIIKRSLTWKNRCYIFLLMSSCLRYVMPFKDKFTSSFEVFSLSVLKSLLPEKAEAHLFGSSNNLINERRYSGHIFKKFKQLQSDLHELSLFVRKEDFAPTDSGDGGFDLVAWFPNGDTQRHTILFTGQAACTEIWDVKQYSSSAAALSTRMSISVNPINIVFIPFSIRNADGEWIRAHDIVQCVLLDRQRLIYHFGSNRKIYLSLPCDKIITELMKFKDSPYN